MTIKLSDVSTSNNKGTSCTTTISSRLVVITLLLIAVLVPNILPSRRLNTYHGSSLVSKRTTRIQATIINEKMTTTIPQIIQQRNETTTILPLCSFQRRNSTCAFVFAQNPSLLQECKKNPSLNQCQLDCWDLPTPEFPQASLGVLLHENNENDKAAVVTDHPTTQKSKETIIWPPLDSKGHWMEDLMHCQKVVNTTSLCLFDRYRYRMWEDNNNDDNNHDSSSSILQAWTQPNACKFLHQHQISTIHMVGDSLMRHLTQAMAIVLTGDDDGLDYAFPNNCVGDTAFSETRCRVSVNTTVCPVVVSTTANPSNNSSSTTTTKKSIRLTYWPTNPRHQDHIPAFPLPISDPNKRILHFYGVGNHPASGKHDFVSRYGILNAHAYHQTKWKQFQNHSHFWGRPQDYFVLVPPHYKIRIGRTDETNQRSRQFLKDSHDLLKSLGAITVNTWEMTHALSRFLSYHPVSKEFLFRETCQKTLVTWDGYHYSLAINVWKVHLMFHRLQRWIEEGK